MLLLLEALRDLPPHTTCPSAAQTKLVMYNLLPFHGHVLSSISPEVFNLITHTPHFHLTFFFFLTSYIPGQAPSFFYMAT